MTSASPVVDAHAHVWGNRSWRSETTWKDFAGTWASLSGRTFAGPSEVLAAFEREAVPLIVDVGATRLIDEMDEAGIDYSVIMNIDLGVAVGEAPVPWAGQWAELAELSAHHGGRLVLAPGLDPRRDDAAGILLSAARDWNIRAIKLWPPAGFYPTDDVCRPVYEAARHLGLPVIIHSAFAPPPYLAKYAEPLYLDAVAVDYPDVTFVMAHVGPGLGWYRDAVAVATTKPNVYLEFSMWQGVGDVDPHTVAEAVTFMRDRVGAERLLFGTDRTGTKLRLSVAEWVEMFRRLPATARSFGYELSEDEAALILGGNAARLFRIDEQSKKGR